MTIVSVNFQGRLVSIDTEECTKEITPEENVDSADVNPGCDPNEPCDENETAIHLSYSAVVSSKAAQTTCSTSTQKPSKQSESTGLPELSGAHFSPQRKQQRSRGKKTAAAAAAAAAVTAQPEQKQLPEQTEEGWEVSGSKTFKRNRKNRSSVKSSVKSYSVQASPDPTPIPLPEEPVPAKEQAEAVVVAIAITDVAEREETVEEAAVAPEVPKRRNNAQKKQNKQRARREREERALSEERLLAESAVADTAPSRQVGSSKPETVQETARPASYPTSVRPVLIQDGILDVAASSAAFRKVKRVNEVFQDPSRIAQV